MLKLLISLYFCGVTICQDAALSSGVFRNEQSWLLWCIVVLLLLCGQIKQINLIGDMQRRNKLICFRFFFFLLGYQCFTVGFSLVWPNPEEKVCFLLSFCSLMVHCCSQWMSPVPHRIPWVSTYKLRKIFLKNSEEFSSSELLKCGCMWWSTAISPLGYLPANFRSPETCILSWICEDSRLCCCSLASLKNTFHPKSRSCKCRGLVGMKIPPEFLYYEGIVNS